MPDRILVTNPTRRRKWGWGWSCTPTGKDAYSIEVPVAPDFTGTLRQVYRHISEDRTFKSLRSGGTFCTASWFYDGKRIINRDEFLDWLTWGCGQGWPVVIEVEVKDE